MPLAPAFKQGATTVMRKLGTEDSTSRLIDDVRSLSGSELDALEAEHWLLVDITERRARNGSVYYRHRFSRASAPHKGIF
jgi:hypothetical protein